MFRRFMIYDLRITNYFGIVMLFWVVSLSAQGPDTAWTRTYGDTLWDEAYDVQQTLDGGYIITGFTEDSTSTQDVWLIKTDSLGNTIWTKTYGGTSWDEGWSVQQTSDNGYIIAGATSSFGISGSDAYLIKTNVNGDSVWARTYNIYKYDCAYSVKEVTGGYIITGTAYPHAWYSDIFLIKTKLNGDLRWTKIFGGSNNVDDAGRSVIVTANGYVIAGHTDYDGYLIKTDSLQTLWTSTFDNGVNDETWSVQQTTDGGYIVAGFTNPGSGDNDVWLIKTTANGDSVWAKTYGAIRDDKGYSVQQTTDGGYIIAGFSEDSLFYKDVYLIKTDSLGDSLWAKTYGGQWDDWAYSVRQTSDGNYIIAGGTYSFGAGHKDVYLIKTKVSSVGIEEEESIPGVFFISQCCPNPFRDETVIGYRLSVISNISLKVYDLTGRLVKTLVDEEVNVGSHTVVWDGRDDSGVNVPSGIYFYRLKVDGSRFIATRKIVVTR
ncbi:T9SS type A sorting domain-containing protein [candidate division WOR-3 bacterium]|nr:T9SS type A sorting domain-containing protein [candidate division WOR-3 bacterium]